MKTKTIYILEGIYETGICEETIRNEWNVATFKTKEDAELYEKRLLELLKIWWECAERLVSKEIGNAAIDEFEEKDPHFRGSVHDAAKGKNPYFIRQIRLIEGVNK